MIICLIQHFEADFPQKVSPKILNSGLILTSFTHEVYHILFKSTCMGKSARTSPGTPPSATRVSVNEVTQSISNNLIYSRIFGENYRLQIGGIKIATALPLNFRVKTYDNTWVKSKKKTSETLNFTNSNVKTCRMLIK